MARILRGDALEEKKYWDGNAAWVRSTWRGPDSPLFGVTPQSFEVAPGLLMIRQWEYLSMSCTRCRFFDNYCTWDTRLSVAGPGHRELNRWLCQRCYPEFEAWRKAKSIDVHITAWLDLPDDGLIAWKSRRQSGQRVSLAA